MATKAAETAKSVVTAHLTADSNVNAEIINGSADKLGRGTTITVEASTSTYGLWRTLVDLKITAYTRYKAASVGDIDLTAAMDSVLTSITGMRSGAQAFWLGPSSSLSWEEPDTVEHDGARFATAELEATVAVKSDHVRQMGSSEQAVADMLKSAGFTVVGASDEPPFVVTRWGGNSAQDPYVDEIMVIVAEELESGRIEESSRSVWKALYQSGMVAVTDRIDVDPVGVPPGSDGSYETAQIMCNSLTVREV